MTVPYRCETDITVAAGETLTLVAAIGPDGCLAITTTTAADVTGGILTVEDDGYYPWPSPPPTMANYEEGCRTPERVAKFFVSIVGDDPDVPLTVLSESPTRIEFLALSRDGDGVVHDTGTVLTMARIDPGLVDCEAWGVLSAAAPDDVVIDSPTAGSAVGSEIAVTGSGRGFEAYIGLRVLDEFLQPVGDGFAYGGWEMAPYSGVVTLGRRPSSPNLMVVASSEGAIDGSTPPFSVRYDGSLGGPPPGDSARSALCQRGATSDC